MTITPPDVLILIDGVTVCTVRAELVWLKSGVNTWFPT